MGKRKRISERKVILFTGVLLIIAGIIRLFSYSVGIVLFYLAFVPYLLVRIHALHGQRGTKSSSMDKARGLILIGMFVTIVLNIAGWQEANFLLIFFLMIDFLLVTNRKF